MRFTPSTEWSIANSAAYRKVAWTTEVRISTDLDDALFSGTWTQIDSMIHEMDDPSQKIEHNPGQFTADSITLTVGNIVWWNTNFLTTTDYIEFRRRPSIGIGASMMSADSACMFYGFIDNREGQLHYNNEKDEVTFTARTPDDIGDGISALNVNTQYLNPDIDGAGTDGLILPTIPGVFVKSANVASYVLKKGLHSLTYQYNAGTEQIKLDDGDYYTLPGGDAAVTLVNGDGDEKIQLYIDVSELPTTVETTEYVIVITAGTTLPRQPYYNVSINTIFKKLYEQIGLTTVTFDTLQFNTHDSVAKISYYDIPPEDVAVTGSRNAVVQDSSGNIWVSVGRVLYKRNMTTHSYTSILTVGAAGDSIKRMFYNTRNDEIWMLIGSGTDAYCTKVVIYNIPGNTNNAVTLGSSGTIHVTQAVLMDYNYGGTDYHYALIFKDNVNDNVDEIDTNGNQTNIFSSADLTFTVIFVTSGGALYFDLQIAAQDYIRKFHVEGDGTWFDDSNLANYPAIGITNLANAYLELENKVYYLHDTTIYSWVLNSASAATSVATSVLNLSSMYAGNSQVFATSGPNQLGMRLIGLSSDAATTLDDNVVCDTSVNTPFFFDSGNTVLYGIDQLGRLFRYAVVLQMYLKNTVWEDMSVKSAINQCLGAYNLIGKISSHKKVNILRRGNDAGTKLTTGSAIIINNTNCIGVEKTENLYPAVAWVEVSNDDSTHSYDGTTFDSKVFSVAKTFTISNPLIPTEMIKHVAKYFYAFWSVARTTYQFLMKGAPMEYEVMDGADITITGQYVNITSSAGLIINQSVNKFGRVAFEVLI